MFPILFAATVSQPAYIAMLAGLAGLGGYALLRSDGRVESRRRNSVKLSRVAAENGFPHVTTILDAYAVGDYSGALAAIGSLHETLTDEPQRKAAFNAMLSVQLDKRLADVGQREELFRLIETKGGVTIDRKTPPKAA